MNTFILFFTILSLNLFFFYKFDYISKFLNLCDTPDGKLKKHNKPVSLLGGLSILINLYFIILLMKFLGLDNFLFKDNFSFIMLFLATVFYLIGVVDDIKNLSPNLKLILVVLSITLMIFLFPELKLKLIKISFLDKFYYFNNFSTFFVILSFALLLNALNMFDGVNLQLILFSIFVFCFFILRDFISIFFLVLLIPMIFLAILNFKNKIFLGDGGVYILSAIIGCTFIYQYKNYENFLYGDEIFLILFLPAIDMLRLFILRIIDKKNPFKGDLRHLHHLINVYTKKNIITIIITLTLSILPSVLFTLNIKTFYVLFFSLLIYIFLIFYLRYKNR